MTAEAAAKPDIAAAVDEPVAMAESVEAPPDDAEAYDEAMLELVAMEMSAPDFDDADTEFAIPAPEAHLDEPPQAQVAEPVRLQVADPPQVPIAEPPQVAEAVEPSQVDALPAAIAQEPIAAQQPALPSPPVAPEPAPSLGATILASGLVTRPKTPANDPLAPIRRMTQAEKIAFFS